MRVPHTFDAFVNPSYRWLWTSNFFSYISRWMQMTMLAWLVLQLTDSPFKVALVGFFGMGPMLLLGIVGGLLADKSDKRKLLMITQTANLIAAIIMAGLLFTGNIVYWHAYIVMMVSGTGWALDMPSRRSIVIDLLGRARVTNAVALDSIGMHSSRMIGPALGGLLITLVDVKGGYVVSAIFYALSIILMATVTLPEGRVRPAVTNAASNVFRNLGEGFTYVRGHNTLMAVVLITIFMNFLLFPYQQMIPVLADRVLEVGPGRMGLLLAIEGFGALIGALVIASRSDMRYHGRVYLYGSLLALSMLLMLSLSRWYGVSLGVLLIMGLGTSGFGTMQGTIVMLVARDDMRGRALGIMTLAIGAGPLGALAIGAVANAIGAPFAMTINAIAGFILVGIIGIFWVSIRQQLIPDNGDEEEEAEGPEPDETGLSGQKLPASD
ncbi:MAG: MFS transporter [Chloroflexi bacterium]|nr:MFS transporter [Chloroflexota bacterium]